MQTNKAQNDYKGVEFTEGDYLIIFNNTEDYENQVDAYGKHEIAVYDKETKTVKYYKKVTDGDTYNEVNKDGSPVVAA